MPRPVVCYRNGGAWTAICWDCKAEDEGQAAREAARQQARDLERRLGAMGILQSPRRRVADLVLDGHNASVLEWAAEPKRDGGAYLWGLAGRGKTSVLEAICVDACHAGLTARYFLLADLLARAKAGFDDDHLPNVVEEAAKADVLVIDNLDGVSLSIWGRSMISELAQRRYQRRGSVFTAWGATISPDEAGDLLDIPAVASRWKDWGPVFHLRGPSRRRAA